MTNIKHPKPTCPDCEGTRVQDQDYVNNKPCATCNGRGALVTHVHLRSVGQRTASKAWLDERQ